MEGLIDVFEKKRCSNCGEKVGGNYNFCQHCGESLKEKKYGGRWDVFGDFGGVFKNVEKEFERIDKSFFEMPRKMPSISFRMPRSGGGISVTITSGTGMKPKVDVKTYGEYKKVEPDIRRKLGVRGPVEEIEESMPERRQREPKSPKFTEEPEAEIKDIGAKQVIRIKLPDVRSEEDVDVKRLEQSIEVKAIAGDKAYFKLIPIKGRSVENKGFRDGVLTLEVSK